MATVVDLAGFRLQFPEVPVSLADDDLVERCLVEAKLIHGFRPLATLYVAAHLVRTNPELTKGISPAGPVTMDGGGPLKIGYQQVPKERTAFQEFFMRTEYGRRFLQLESRSPSFAIGAVVCG